MEIKKFYGAEDAARFAASITDRWQTEDGEIWNVSDLLGAAECADGENPLDEDDSSTYYLVDKNGALGYTGDNCTDIYWWVTPVYVKPEQKSSIGNFCTFCGTRLRENSKFCPGCGRKL